MIIVITRAFEVRFVHFGFRNLICIFFSWNGTQVSNALNHHLSNRLSLLPINFPFERLIILAVMGLGALYLMHLLAKDYMKIRKPAAKLAKFLLTKRDLEAVSSIDKTKDIKSHEVYLCRVTLLFWAHSRLLWYTNRIASSKSVTFSEIKVCPI